MAYTIDPVTKLPLSEAPSGMVPVNSSSGLSLGGDTTSPYTKFNNNIASILTQIQNSASKGRENLGGAIDTLTTQSVGAGGAYNNQATPGVNLQSQQGTMGAFAPAITSLNTQLANANAGIAGLTPAIAAIQTANQPEVLSPGQSLVSKGGETIYGGGGSDLNSLAQAVIKGTLTPSQAESQISYNPLLKQQLSDTIQKLQPGFSYTTAEQNATARGNALNQNVQTGLPLLKSAQATNDALDLLTTQFNNLSGWQTGGIPFTNKILNMFAGGAGDKDLQTYKTTLADARSQLLGVLNASGGTPTGNEKTALEYLPDNMTVGQFMLAVGTPEAPGTVRKLIEQKVQAFNNTQNVPQLGNTGGGQTSSDPMELIFGKSNPIGAYATDPEYIQKINSVYTRTANDVKSLGYDQNPVAAMNQYIKNQPGTSPVTGAMVIDSANAYGIDPLLLASVLHHESDFGTDGVGAKTMNPGNQGNTGSATRTFNSWREGVNATASNLANRIKAVNGSSSTGGNTPKNGVTSSGIKYTIQ